MITRERGFTLIELMIALVISSLLVGMILAIFSRMSMSYRGQQQIAGVQQVLAAARATIELDAKQAGLEVANGFRIANDAISHPAVVLTDNGTAPDTVAFFYADTTTQAVVTNTSQWATANTLTVDSTAGFNATTNPLVVMVNINTSTANGALAGLNPNDAVITDYDACVLYLSQVTSTQLKFTTSGPWGALGEPHCTNVTVPVSSAVAPTANQTMIFNFIARKYRIDPTRPALGVLQVSPTGGLLPMTTDWMELAYGFTDLQVATRFYDPASTGDADSDGDALRNWFSANAQNTQLASAVPLQTSISLVARTDRPIEGIATAQTPNLTDPAKPNNNTLGNHASVALPSATDPALMGSFIYRYITFQVDFRNLGVGR